MNNYNISKFLKELIVALLLVFTLGITIYKIKSHQDNKYWDSVDKEQTITTVTGYTSGPKASGSAVATYIVNDKEYSVSIEESYVYEEKFQLEYNRDNPSENKIYRELPVFQEGELVNYTVGKLVSYNSWFFRNMVYKFWIEDRFYVEGQYQEEDSNTKYTNVEEGQLFVVEYWLDNPKRSIIHLDKPVKYISEWWKYKVDENGETHK
ncbi:hypothetical protein [Aestuariibaculum lutulentum]|uniref:DUF3592 domain-containing protein n=1 Tax=Aestuariibaculum lutulentum TaxID=2920935 RepID=A0ABS9RMG0_9FLAO|nr:hypothetical protein [Aestuariibaculum lutulentum]MCH4554132.1 hypothetical protein [Aestuariibaculum lutulentum]